MAVTVEDVPTVMACAGSGIGEPGASARDDGVSGGLAVSFVFAVEVGVPTAVVRTGAGEVGVSTRSDGIVGAFAVSFFAVSFENTDDTTGSDTGPHKRIEEKLHNLNPCCSSEALTVCIDKSGGGCVRLLQSLYVRYSRIFAAILRAIN
jgi:hypothetical protein